MELSVHVAALREDLEALAAVGDDSVAEAARRLTRALEPALTRRLLDALSQAALELGEQLPAGHVEVRLAGGDAQLVYVEAPAATHTPDDDAAAARVTLRLPEALKGLVDAAADQAGVSMNSWIVRALARQADPPRPGNRLRGYGRS